MKRLMLFCAAALAATTLFGANPTSRIAERLNYANEWSNYSKVDYQYDNDGNLISEINFIWNQYENVWAQSLKTDYVYSDNKLAEKTVFAFIAANNAWKPLYRSEFSYEKDKTIETEYSYNNYVNKTEDWSLLRKTVTAYKNQVKVSEDLFGWEKNGSAYFVMPCSRAFSKLCPCLFASITATGFNESEEYNT
jgi:hypothetical protein